MRHKTKKPIKVNKKTNKNLYRFLFIFLCIFSIAIIGGTSYIYVYTTNSEGFFNLTENSSLGARLILNSTNLYNSTSGDVKSFVFYNSTSSFWNMTFRLSNFSAVGGTITQVGAYTIHTFTSNGTFNVTGVGNIDVLVVAGGGGGGGINIASGWDGGGGGGGAGGVVIYSGRSVVNGSYNVTVGVGGAGQTRSVVAKNGANSSFDNITAIGGGKGGQNSVNDASSGGSGGGSAASGAHPSYAGGISIQTNSSGGTGYGYPGGTNWDYDPYGAGGGGGARERGTNATPSTSGKGGDGINNSFNGSIVTYAGGGGGALWGAGTSGAGGAGGGGAGGSNGTNATANTGGGGGGGAIIGGYGGSGIVIVRYLTQTTSLPSTNITLQTRTANNYNLTDPSLVALYSFNDYNEDGGYLCDDNNPSCFRVVGADWTYIGTGNFGWNDSTYQRRGGTGNGYGHHNITVPVTGSYYVSYHEAASGYNVGWQIYHLNTSDGVINLNQTWQGYRWVNLGYYNFTAGQTYYLRVNDTTAGNLWVFADAVYVSQKHISPVYNHKTLDGTGDMNIWGSIQVPYETSGTVGKGWYSPAAATTYVIGANSSIFDSTFNNTLSVSFWFNTSVWTTANSILMKTSGSAWSNGWGFYKEASNKIRFFVNSYSATYAQPTAALNLNQMYHIVGVYNKTKVIMYVNGVKTEGSALAANITYSPYPLIIGHDGPGLVQSELSGGIDEIRIYNRTLNDTEVLDLYNLGATHFSDWSAWSTASSIKDGNWTNSSTAGKFMQFMANFYTNNTAVSPFLLNYSVITSPTGAGPTSITFNNISSENSFAISQFVKVNGTNFTLSGNRYTFQGADFYYAYDYAVNHTFDDAGNEINNSVQYVDSQFDKLKALNVNVIRVWAMTAAGNSTTNWVQDTYGGRVNTFLNGNVTNYNETVFKGLDYVIWQAGQHDIRVQLTFVNNWDTYGGMNFFVLNSPTTSKNGYTPSSSSDAFHDQFYNDSWCMSMYQAYINYTFNRVNTYSGRVYKNDPTIFAYDFTNEARAKSNGLNRNLIRDWTKNMTNFSKAQGVQSLIALGIEGFGYAETWGEGTDMFNSTNGTGVDFATFELHPAQWDYFAQRSENETNGKWVNGSIYSGLPSSVLNLTLDWWTIGGSYTYNNRYSGGNVADYVLKLPRHGYQNWVAQNTNWSNQMNLPVVLQEVALPTNLSIISDSQKDRFFQQAINSFYSSGGDGFLMWNFNHPEYYTSTTGGVCKYGSKNGTGCMDDGYSFYWTSDTYLNSISAGVIRSFNFTLHNNTGGTSWVTLLNNYNYTFYYNISLNGIVINNCSLWLDVVNQSNQHTNYIRDQTNQTEILDGNISQNAFNKLFQTTDVNATWYTSCRDNSNALYNSSSQTILLANSPIITLTSPVDGNISSIPNFTLNYTVASSLGITNCSLYLDGNLNQTNLTTATGVNQFFKVNVSSLAASHAWQVVCIDTGGNIGYSAPRTFIYDTGVINVTLLSPLSGSIIDDRTPNLTAYVNSFANISTISLYIDGVVQWIYSLAGSIYEITIGSVDIIVSTIIDGFHTWYYEVVEMFGITKTSDTWNFTLYSCGDWAGNGTQNNPCLVNTCGNASNHNFYYNVTNDLNLTASTGNCLYISGENITITGNGYTLNGSVSSFSNTWGITIENSRNITIKNVNFTNWLDAIFTTNMNSSNLYNNSFERNARSGIFLTYSNNNTLENNTIFGGERGISISYSNTQNDIFNNKIYNTSTSRGESVAGIFLESNNVGMFIKNNIIHSDYDGIFINVASGDNNTIENNSLKYNTRYGIAMMQNNYNNIFLNNFITNSTQSIYWDGASSNGNKLIYNNTFGEILWYPTVFVETSDLSFPGNVTISNNYAYVNSLLTGLNKTANITLYGLPTNFKYPLILKNGLPCSTCYNFTSLNAGTVVFNVSGFSNYSISNDTIAPNLTYNGKYPSDLNLTLFLGPNGVNISYNITDNNDDLNISSIVLFFKANSSVSNIMYYQNGSSKSGYFRQNNFTNSSSVFVFNLLDNSVLPGTYNYDEFVLENTVHSSVSLANQNSYLSVELLNVSNTTAYGWYEAMVDRNAGAGALRYYYCNSSYAFGNLVSSNSNCVNFYTQTNLTPDHLHTMSNHSVVPFPVNTTTGTISGIKVTSDSYFMIRGNIGPTNFRYYYITPSTRTDAIKTTANGGILWTSQTYSAEGHLHQYDLNSSLWYYSCANDTTNNQNCSSPRQDLFGLAGLPPTSVSIYSPTENFYRGIININYTASFSPNDYAISYYNISLANLDETFNKTIRTNNSINLSYAWDSSTTPDGTYLIKVRAYDSLGQSSIAYSENFTIDNTKPNATLVSPSNNSYLNYSNINFTANLSDNITGIKNYTLYIYNQTVIVNQTSQTNSVSAILEQVVGIVVNLIDNVYTWFYELFDYSGNNYISENYTLTVDTTAPVINITTLAPNPANFTIDDINLTYNVSDLHLQYWYFNITNSSGALIFGNNRSESIILNHTLFSSAGLYQINIWANDSLGNIGMNNKSLGVINVSDLIAPTLNITYPLNGSSLSFPGFINFTLNTTTSDASGISSEWYSINGGTNVTFTNSTYIHIEQPDTTSYGYTLRVYVNDTFNNVNTTLISFTIIQTAQPVGTPSGGGGGGGGGTTPQNVSGNRTIPIIPAKKCSTESIQEATNCITNIAEKNWSIPAIIGIALLTAGITFIIIKKKRKEAISDKQ